MIEAARLSKNYGPVRAVRDVSFSVGAGEIVGLLGPNGAGKTTIMKILTGYHYPSSGVATIAGRDVAQDPVGIKAQIGYLPENAPLYDDLTVGEYLDWITDARGLDGTERATAIARAVDLCGLDDHIDRPISQLSKGYRQRVGLAQAIVHDPAILILDEPTTGLDPNQIQEIRHLIRTLGNDKTVILSTHILQEVEAMCDRVLILNDGAIAASGTTEEIGRELKGETVYTLEIASSNVPDAVPAQLAKLGNIVEQETKQAVTTYRIAVGSDVSGEDLCRVAVEHGLLLRSLVLERYSLEDIFTQLTKRTEESE